MTTSHVFDTYATTAKGRTLHFDVVLDEQNPELALDYAQQWLQSIGEGDANVSLKTCVFCHSAEVPVALRNDIDKRGYAIIKMEGCPA
ncbi:MAG: DUF2024 family protein [Methylococcaceae bacterium]|nr:DUF2024 family protein [Methylococcaceae bacterium]